MEPRPNTMCPALRPTSIPSGILIHKAVWPQYIFPEIGGCALFWVAVRRTGSTPYVTQCGLGRGLYIIHTKWHVHPPSRFATTNRAGFSLIRALFRKNVGALPNIRIPPD